METIIYKGIEITKNVNFYHFYFNDYPYNANNLHYAKILITRFLSGKYA